MIEAGELIREARERVLKADPTNKRVYDKLARISFYLTDPDLAKLYYEAGKDLTGEAYEHDPIEAEAAEAPELHRSEYRIPAVNSEDMEAEITKINARLIKKGIAASVSFTRGASFIHERKLDSGRKLKIETIPYSVSFPDLKLAGDWRLIGALDHESGSKAIVKAIPGETIPIEYREAGSDRCDHCLTKRRRKDTFALQSGETGEIKIVGRQCIRDFLGIDPSGALYVFDLWRKLRDFFSDREDPDYYGSRIAEAFPLSAYLSLSACYIRKEGYATIAQAKETGGRASGSYIWELAIDPRGKLAQALDLFPETITEADRDLGKRAEAWILSLSEAEITRSEYLYNLQAIAEAAIVNFKTKGYSASMIPAFTREDLRKREHEKVSAASIHIGSPKERIKNVTLTINGIREYEGNFGVCYIVNMSDQAGSSLIWWGSFDPRDRGYDIGGSYSADFTVKKHGEYKGIKQTTITRVSFGKAQSLTAGDK